MTDIKNAITTPFDHLDFIIQPFNKATAVTIHKIVGNNRPVPK
jgi:hypothetical protein